MPLADPIADRVTAAVDAWLRWLPSWKPGSSRRRARLCRRCTGSPVLVAAGLVGDVPHQVSHALNLRLQRIIDRSVQEYTDQRLPLLRAELAGEQQRSSSDVAPVDRDPESEGEQLTLFTMADFVEEGEPDAPSSRPPLTSAEKQQLRREIECADRCANDVGERVCIALVEHRQRIAWAIDQYVEPHIQALLAELAAQLSPPHY